MFLKNALDMQGYVLLGGLEKLGHSSLGQPDRLAIEPHLKPQRSVAVNQHLTGRNRLWVGWYEMIAHAAFTPI